MKLHDLRLVLKKWQFVHALMFPFPVKPKMFLRKFVNSFINLFSRRYKNTKNNTLLKIDPPHTIRVKDKNKIIRTASMQIEPTCIN